MTFLNFLAGTSLALDGATTGSVYSFRKLVTAYAGNCVRIRESGGNTEQDFGFVNNVVDTAGIATFVGGNSGFIVTWYDQGGGAVDVTQATSAAQPLFVASGINSLPTARFDGSDDRLANAAVLPSSLGTLGPPSEISWFAVLKQDAAKADNHAFQYRSGTSNLTGYSNLADVVSWDWTNATNTAGGGRVTAAQPSGYDDNPHVIDGYRSTADAQELSIDGVSIVSATRASDPTNSSATFAVGDEQQTGGDDNFDGDLSELIFLKNYSSSTQSAIRANLGAYYGVTVA